MLYVIFRLGKDRYAVEASHIVEVLPLINWKSLPQSLPGVAGVMDYHGTPVPLIDLRELTLGTPSRPYMSTRILLVNYHKDSAAGDGANLLGILTERSVMTSLDDERFVTSGIEVEGTPYLGPVATDEDGIIQRVEIGQLLTEEIRDLLFREVAESM